MKTLILILCGLMLLTTNGNSMAHYCGPFNADELLNDNPRNDHGIWITGGEAKNDGIYYNGKGTGLNISLGNNEPYYPSMDRQKAFSIAMTFKAGSIKPDNNADLFTSFFRKDSDSTTGLNLGISYDGTSFHADVKEDKVNGPKQLIGSLGNEDLTIIINQSSVDNKLSITFYSGRTNIGEIDYGSVFSSNNICHDFTLGSNDTELTLKGLGLIVNGSLSDPYLNDYFDKVGVQSVPEPGIAIFTLIGSILGLCKRKRI